MQKELISLFSAVALPPTVFIPLHTGRLSNIGVSLVNPEYPNLLNSEVGTLGYTLDGAVLDALRALTIDQFESARKDLLAVLVELTGSTKNHQTLFRHFPHQTPEQSSYLLSRLIGYVQNTLNYAPKNFSVLSCGHVVDHNLFDLDDFGACPICQRQVAELPWREARPNTPFNSITPLKVLVLADQGFITDRGNALLARNSSLSEDEKAFLRQTNESFVLTAPDKLFKETLPFAYTLLGVEKTLPHLSGATDVLRIMAFLSSDTADLSLKEPFRFALSTQHARSAMTMLESLDNLEEDLLRHHERWKRFAKHVHVGSKKNRARFPKTTAAFDRLHKAPKSIETFGRIVEGKMRSKKIDERLLRTLERRPGEFTRRLDFLLRTQANGPVGQLHIISALKRVVPNVTTKMLIGLAKYLGHRGGQTGARVFYPKGNANRVQIREDRRKPISDAALHEAYEVVSDELLGRFSELEPMGNVFIHPDLNKIVVPLNRRGDSSTSVAIPKGSRMPFGDAPVCRLFVHWTGRDVDLSILTYDDNLELIEQISWTNLKGYGCVHSGDITYAPDGASEFIDFEIGTMLQRKVRFVVSSAISYSGDTFDTIQAFAGYMERDGLKSGKPYEPKSLALKFDLTAKTRTYMPLVFDLKTREVIFADIASGGGRYASVASQNEKHQTLLKSVLDLANAKPTVYDVLMMHAVARGTLVDDPADAQIVFDMGNLDLEAVQAMTA